MQLAKASSELRHNTAGSPASVFVVSCCRRKRSKYRLQQNQAEISLLFVARSPHCSRTERRKRLKSRRLTSASRWCGNNGLKGGH